jgi:hypothetical protein
MDTGTAIYGLFGLWGLVMVAVFITAIRLCYRVEERSEALRNRTGVPFNANIPAVMFNWGVARDEETQRLRRRMNYRLLACLGGFGLAWLMLWWAGTVGG